MRGSHCVRHWSSSQPTIAVSPGEAELGGLCKGAANGIGMRSLAADLGITWSIKVFTDATAAMGMTRRLGVGKVRHLDTALLWIQSKVRGGDVGMEKVAGADNPADALTKYLPGPLLQQQYARMGLVHEEGRAKTAPAFSPQ